MVFKECVEVLRSKRERERKMKGERKGL